MPPPLLRRLLALPLLLAFAAPLAAAEPVPDPEVAWLRAEAVALRSIAPDDGDFSDLEPLRAVLAGKRVVILGEASHRDGNSLLAKTRLIRFLHRELGFDVLAFESGFYDCAKAWERIVAGDDPAEAFRQSVFPIWTRSAQLKPLIDYFAAAARSPRPLQLAGFDPQFTGVMSDRHLAADLRRVAAAAGMPGEDFDARVSAPLANLVSGKYEEGEMPPEAARAGFDAALAELERRLRAGGGEIPEREFWLRFVETTRQHGANSWAIDWSKPLLEDVEGFAVRDRLMGEQLAWLARHRFAGRKIVAWAASFHGALEVAPIEVPSSPVHIRLFRTFQPMGVVARKELGEELYTVAVLAYQGKYGLAAKPIELLKPSDGSLEDLFHRTGLPYAFLDLSRPDRLPQWLRAPTIARPMGYKEMRAPWGRVFDAVLFLDRMEAADKAK
jgi:erythromycin esterase